MQKLKLSIIGGGNMATAILEGLFNNKLVSPDSIMVTNRSAGKLERLQERWPIKISYNDIEAANFGDVIIWVHLCNCEPKQAVTSLTKR